jgi:TonB family protein
LPLKILSGSEPDARGVRAEAALNGGGDVLRIKVGSGNIKLKFSEAYRSYYEQIYRSLMQQMEQRQQKLLERQREYLEKEQKHLEEEQDKLSGMEELRLRLQEKLVGRIPVDAEAQKRKLIYQVKPIYPEIAKRDRLEGVVRLEALIDKEGKVERLEVIRGNPVLAQAAMEAVRQWRYAPAYLGSKPVAVTTVIQVEFRLE